MANLNFSSVLSPDHLTLQTLIENIDGQIDQTTNSLFANASLITLGNSSVSTIITPDNILSSSFISDDGSSKISINSTAFNLTSFGGANTYISGTQATFSSIIDAMAGLYVAGAIFLDGSISVNSTFGNTGDVLSVGDTGLYWSNSVANASYLGGYAANQYAFANSLNYYQTTAGLADNVATLTANSATHLGGTAASQYVNTTGNYILTGVITHTANIVVGNSTVNSVISANSTNVFFTGVSYFANSAAYLGGYAADQYAFANSLVDYETVINLPTDVLRLTANSANYLGIYPASDYTTVHSNATIDGVYTHSANLSLQAGLLANNQAGTVGQVLASDATGKVFWQTTNGQSISVDDLVITGKLYANGFNGANGLVLTSNGSTVYWSDITNASGGIFDGGTPYSSYINSPRIDAGGVY